MMMQVRRRNPLVNWLMLASVTALICVLAARITGPSDLWDQTQPKTVAYTTDMLVHGGWRWILPIERGELPATKPPLYNWLAAPAVRSLGFTSEFAHKVPSVAALIACWAIIVAIGSRFGHVTADRFEHASSYESALSHRRKPTSDFTGSGWLAGTVFLANYSSFKLGYLARPDMLLTFWLLLAWWCATIAYAHDRLPTEQQTWRSRLVVLALCWIALALAALTKGPAALVGVAYVFLAARALTGRWSGVNRLRPAWGLLICGIVFGAWAYAVWRIDAQHLRDQLWFHEFVGRVTGKGDEGTHHGAKTWLGELPYQILYFITRFAPWSALAVAAIVDSIRKRPAKSGETNPMIRGAAIFVLGTIALFSLNTGKRADYIAVAFPQASLLAAWWVMTLRSRLVIILAHAAAIITLIACIAYGRAELNAPVPGFGDAILRFAGEVNGRVGRDGEVLAFAAGQTHLQAILGIAGDERIEILRRAERGESFWVVAGRLQNAPYEFDGWLRQRRLLLHATPVLRSDRLPRAEGWPERVTLWRVEPARDQPG